MKILDIKATKQKGFPILFAPGWSETCKTLTPFMEEIHQYQKRIITVSHVRIGGEIIPTFHLFYKEGKRKAYTLLKVIESKNIEKADIIAHSEGCINVLLAASEHPELFNHIILVNPAGLVGKTPFFTLANRLISEFLHSRIIKTSESPIKPAWYFLSESLLYVLKNPFRAIMEGYGISQSNTEKLIQELQQKGINFSLIYGEYDRLFPAELIEKHTKELPFIKTIKIHQGKHFDICLYPKRYIPIILEILEK